MNALITIFIPTYKRPNLLKNAIHSALNQTYKNLQIIVCDNASGDETSQIVAELAKTDSRLHYVCHQKNIGMLANYQFALSNVATKFFSLLSDDDILLSDFCETALNGFSQYPEIAFFAGSSVCVSKKNGILNVPLETWPREGLFSKPEDFLEMIGKYPVPTTVLFRKEMIDKVNIDIKNQVAWDCDFLIQLGSQYPFAISKKPCGIFLNHPDSFSDSQNFFTVLDSVFQIIQRVQNFPWIKENLKTSAKKRLQMNAYRIAKHYILTDFYRNQAKDVRNLCRYFFSKSTKKIRIFLFFLFSYVPHFFFFFRKIFTFGRRIFFFIFRKKRKPSPWKKFEEYHKFILDL